MATPGDASGSIRMSPIGYFRGGVVQRYALPPQPGMAGSKDGCIELTPHRNFEIALQDLEGFSHIWVLSWFHDAHGWKPKVQPPLRPGKRGTFATRSPHRPNPIGLSCLQLTKIEGRKLWVAGADLIEGTPILDLKPYVSTYDSYPEATLGWVQDGITPWSVDWSERAALQRDWLADRGTDLVPLLETALYLSPYPRRGHRVTELGEEGGRVFAFFSVRTWRVHFEREDASRRVLIQEIRSGHPPEVIDGDPDERQDVPLHREFLGAFREDELED